MDFNNRLAVQAELTIDGKGYWSSTSKPITINRLAISYVNDEEDFGELRAFFDIKEWNVDHDGLVYTDKTFIKNFKKFLNGMGLDGEDVRYSEAGMQGDDYVSFDVGRKFLSSWKNNS